MEMVTTHELKTHTDDGVTLRCQRRVWRDGHLLSQCRRAARDDLNSDLCLQHLDMAMAEQDNRELFEALETRTAEPRDFKARDWTRVEQGDEDDESPTHVKVDEDGWVFLADDAFGKPCMERMIIMSPSRFRAVVELLGQGG